MNQSQTLRTLGSQPCELGSVGLKKRSWHRLEIQVLNAGFTQLAETPLSGLDTAAINERKVQRQPAGVGLPLMIELSLYIWIPTASLAKALRYGRSQSR
jgi:hypothetical protein